MTEISTEAFRSLYEKWERERRERERKVVRGWREVVPLDRGWHI